MEAKFTVKTVFNKLLANKKLFFASLVALLLLLSVAISTIGALLDRGIRLIAMDPSGEINIKTNITFTFSGDVIEDKDVGTTFSGDIVRFNPQVPGRFRYITRRELRFLPEAPFRPSTKYTVSLQPDIVKLKEKYLAGKRKIDFSTLQFKVESADLNFTYPGEQKKGLLLQARINFNYPVEQRELQRALKLRLPGGWTKNAGFNLNTSEPSANFTITSEPLPQNKEDQTIELSLPSGFQCLGGSIGLKEEFKTSTVLGARKALTIREAAPKSDEAKCWIAVRCSEPVEAKNIADFIRVKPKVKFHAEVEGDSILLKSDQFKPGDNYSVQLTAGLPSLNGLPLARDFTAGVFFGDLEPSLKFNSPGRYLSSHGRLNLGLETVNVEKVNVEISQIFANNIVAYLNNNFSGYYDEETGEYYSGITKVGRVLKSAVIPVGAGKNEMATTPIGFSDYMNGNIKGFFQVVAYDDDERWRQDSKYVIVTDLGIAAKMGGNELVVWVNSLETLEPKAKVKVSLISRNNQTLAAEYTDNQGVAKFEGTKKATAGFDNFVILAELENDFTFVHLPTSLIPTADFEVRGRAHPADGYEGFVYLDRDIFRPGDQANLVSIIRGVGGTVPPEFPAKLEIRQPDGQIFKELQSNTRDRGACEFGFAIPDYAQTGRYTANLIVAEQIIGSCSFSVEEFMPERIKVTAKTDKDQYASGETATVKIEGMNLFGPPAAGRRSELTVKLEPEAFDPPGFHSFVFGDPGQKFNTKDEQLGEEKLDASGIASYTYAFPKGMAPPAKLKAVFHATVLEDAGRAVSSYKAVDFHPYERYVGIKPQAEYYVETNQPYKFKYVVVDKNGKPAAKPKINLQVFKISWNSIYRKNDNGRYEYTSVEERDKVSDQTLNGASGENSYQYVPREYGEYQVVLSDPECGSRAVLTFYASGWGYSPWAMADPDKVQLDLDQTIYKAGGQAKLQIKAPFAGKALVTVEREKVYDYKIVDLSQNTGVVTLPVKDEYKPNVYVSVHLIRSIKSLEKKAPARAFGVIPLNVDCSDHKLDIALDAPAETRPNRPVDIAVKVGKAGDNAYITLAAVDEGICQLTNYGTPNPSEFFYGKQALSIDSYDLYGMLLPEVESVKSRMTPGGDAALDNVRKQNLNPVSVRRVKPVSLWSGLVKLDREGKARVKFDVPQFNGSLRLMAVAASGNSFGSVQKKVIVRDPIVMTPTIPRFVGPLDKFAIPVSVFNGTGKSGSFELKMKTEGPVELTGDAVRSVRLKSQEEQIVYYQLQAKNALGKLTFRIQAKGNGEVCDYKEEVSLRPAVPLITRLSTGAVKAGKPSAVRLEDQWVPGTGNFSLTVAPFPALKYVGGLQYLLGYPYGCVEQTTSKVFPLIYFDDLARATHHDVFKGGNADYYIAQGIEKLEAMQLRSGGFAYWPGGDTSCDWGSVYTAHFLAEARKAGYTVSDRVYNRMMSYLETTARNGDRSEYRLQIRVYALYVLSLAGQPQLSTMAYLKNLALDEMSDYSKAQLAAAYYYAGERKTAKNILPATLAVSTRKQESGGNFNSSVRADAIMLSALADVDPTSSAVYKLVNRLSKAAEIGYWGTTQENAFALMALGKVFSKKSEGDYQGEVLIDGNKIASFDSKKELYLEDRRLGQGEISIRISGKGECYYFLKATGIPNQTGVKEYDRGMAVRRDFLDRNGNRVNLNQIKQGDLLIADLTISLSQGGLENIAVVDMLPAGLEIDNPRLANNANLTWLAKSSFSPDYMDIRDDRIILFISPRNTGTYHFYYALRAVTCGEFTLPSVKAECMYEPDVSSYASSGQLLVNKE